MKQKFVGLIAISVFVLFGCMKSETIYHLSSSEMQVRTDAWKVASVISSSEQIIGEWKATTKDMPDGSKLVEWVRRFEKNGTVTESISSSEWVTGPIRYFSIEKSKLLVSDSPDKRPTEEGEIRTSNGLLFLKKNDGIYVFKRVK